MDPEIQLHQDGKDTNIAIQLGCEIACNVAPVRGAYRVEGWV